MKKSLLLLFLVTFKSYSFSFEENESIEVRWGYNEELNFLYLSYEDEVLFKSETDTNLNISLSIICFNSDYPIENYNEMQFQLGYYTDAESRWEVIDGYAFIDFREGSVFELSRIQTYFSGGRLVPTDFSAIEPSLDRKSLDLDIIKYLKLEKPFRIIIKTQERNLKDYIFSDYFFNNAFEKFEKNCSN